MTNVNTAYRGSLGNVLESAIQAAPKSQGYRVPSKAALAPEPVAQTKLRTSQIDADPIRMMQIDAGRRLVPWVGMDGIIKPRVGYLIELIGLDHVHVKTENGDHLVILRPDIPNLTETEVGTLHHFFVPAGGSDLYAVDNIQLGDGPATRDEIARSIARHEDVLSFREGYCDLVLALDVKDAVLTQLNRIAWNSTAGLAKMKSWHRDLICDGMNH